MSAKKRTTTRAEAGRTRAQRSDYAPSAGPAMPAIASSASGCDDLQHLSVDRDADARAAKEADVPRRSTTPESTTAEWVLLPRKESTPPRRWSRTHQFFSEHPSFPPTLDEPEHENTLASGVAYACDELGCLPNLHMEQS